MDPWTFCALSCSSRDRATAPALLTLAGRTGRDLAAEHVEILAMNGVTNIRTFATRYGPHGVDVRLTGLYDAPEEPFVRHGLAAAGLPPARNRAELEALGVLRLHHRPRGRAHPRTRPRGRRSGHRGGRGADLLPRPARPDARPAGLDAARARPAVPHRKIRTSRPRYAYLLLDALPLD